MKKKKFNLPGLLIVLFIGLTPLLGFRSRIAEKSGTAADTVKTHFVVVETSSEGKGGILKDIGKGRSRYVEAETPIGNPTPVKLTWANFNGYGNSIMAGASASATGNQFINRLGAITGFTFNNYAVSGIGVKELNSIFYTHTVATSTTAPVIIEIGTNNLRNSNSRSKQANLKEGLNNILINQFADTVVSASNVRITKTGTWSNLSTSGVLASKSNAYALGTPQKSTVAGSTMSFTWYGNNLAVLTYGADLSHNFGSFKISVDGVDKLTWSANGKGDDWYYSAYSICDFRTPSAVLLTNMGAGGHHVVITTLENKEIDIDAIVRLLPGGSCAPIQLAHVLKSTPAGYVLAPPVYSNNASVDSANKYIDTLVYRFQRLGFPVTAAITEKFINMSTDFVGTDGLHPNDSGHLHIAQAYADNISMTTNPYSLIGNVSGELQYYVKNTNTGTAVSQFKADNGSHVSTYGIAGTGWALNPAAAGAALWYNDTPSGSMIFNGGGGPLRVYGASKLLFSDGNGRMVFGPEIAAFEKSGDAQFGVFTATTSPVVGTTLAAAASYTMGYTGYQNINGKYPGFEVQEEVRGTAIKQNVMVLQALERESDGGTFSYKPILNLLANGDINIPNPQAVATTPKYLLARDSISGDVKQVPIAIGATVNTNQALPAAYKNVWTGNKTTEIQFTLPAMANVNDECLLGSINTGGIKILQNAGDQIIYTTSTTIGTSGYFSISGIGAVHLRCIVANTGSGGKWLVQDVYGTISTN